MTDFRLTHPTRGTLEFRQAQTSEDKRESVADIAPELGEPDPPLVHIKTQDRKRTLRGRVTAPKRARNDPDTSEWRQALANYVVQLESHLDEFQGAQEQPYTFEDDIRNESFPAVYESIEWTRPRASPFELQFEIGCLVGYGTMETRARQTRDLDLSTPKNVVAKVGGEDLPGMRQFRSKRQIEYETNAVYNTTSAKNNEHVPQGGETQQWVFEGTITGSESSRASKDDALRNLQGSQVEMQTKWPGYDIDGYVLDYRSNMEARFGTQRHQFTLTFIEGIPDPKDT